MTNGRRSSDHSVKEFGEMAMIDKTERGGYFSDRKIGLLQKCFTAFDNLRLVRGLGWYFLTRLKGNRLVSPDKLGLQAVSEIGLSENGRVVWLKGFGLVKVFRIIAEGSTAAALGRQTKSRWRIWNWLNMLAKVGKLDSIIADQTVLFD